MRPPPSDLSGPAGVEAKRPPAASAGLIEGFGDAWRHGRSRPGIFSCMVTVTLVSVLGSPLFSFLAKFNDDAKASHLAAVGGGGAKPAEAVQDNTPAEAPAEETAGQTADGEPEWANDAMKELKKIPFFVRGKARRNTEAFAAEQGLALITVETLYDAKAHFAR